MNKDWEQSQERRRNRTGVTPESIESDEIKKDQTFNYDVSQFNETLFKNYTYLLIKLIVFKNY